MTTAFDRAVLDVRAGRDDLEVATGLVGLLTVPEKLALLDGDKEFWRGMLDFYVDGYNTEPLIAGQVERLGIPGIRFADGPRGCVVGHGTAFPVAMARGASWDPDLERRVGQAIGAEARSQGANFFAGVCINLLRHPAWGRAQETYGEDPVLLGAMGEALVRGAQEHVMACVKHFALNSMENARFSVDVTVAPDALREVYLPHFRQVVDAGVAAVMSSYNAVNGTWAGDNRELLTGILREEWGFEGFVVSDFIYGLRDPVGSVGAGLDVEMPFRQQRAGTLEAALVDGRLGLVAVEQAGARVLRMQLRFAAAITRPVPDVSVMASPQHRALARYVAGRSAVLLRNTTRDGRRLLPLTAAEMGDVAVLGRLAAMDNTGDLGSSNVRSPHVVSIAEGLVTALGVHAVTLDDGTDLERARRIARAAQTAVVVVGYTAADEGEYIDDDNPDLTSLLFPEAGDPTLVLEFNQAQRRNAGEFGSASGGDRRSLRLMPEHEDLIRAVCAVNPRTVVVIVAGSAVVVEPWHDLPAATVFGWYAGMEGGHALADVLLGTVEPAGRLPFVIPTDESQLPEFEPDAVAVEYDYWYGYRRMDRDGTTPRYPFGFGLGYGEYSIVQAAVDTAGSDLRVDVTVENRGRRDGSHVVQVYGGPLTADPTRPRRQLLGFARVDVPAGGTATASVPVSLRPIERWDTHERTWRLREDAIVLEIGSHHGDPRATCITVPAQQLLHAAVLGRQVDDVQARGNQ